MLTVNFQMKKERRVANVDYGSPKPFVTVPAFLLLNGLSVTFVLTGHTLSIVQRSGLWGVVTMSGAHIASLNHKLKTQKKKSCKYVKL